MWWPNHNPKGGGLVVKDNRKALKHLRMESRMERRVSVRKSNGHCPCTAMAMVNGKMGVATKCSGSYSENHQLGLHIVQTSNQTNFKPAQLFPIFFCNYHTFLALWICCYVFILSILCILEQIFQSTGKLWRLMVCVTNFMQKDQLEIPAMYTFPDRHNMGRWIN